MMRSSSTVMAPKRVVWISMRTPFACRGFVKGRITRRGIRREKRLAEARGPHFRVMPGVHAGRNTRHQENLHSLTPSAPAALRADESASFADESVFCADSAP